MRIIICILLSFLIGVLKTYAQTHTITKSSSTTVKINKKVVHEGGDLSLSENENSYFSISDSDDTYKVRAKFHDRKTALVRGYLLQEFGEKNMIKSGSKLQWRRTYNGDIGYEVKLEGGKLRIFLNKEVASAELLNKFKLITRNIKYHTSNTSNENRDQERMQREAERLLREAEIKIDEAERLQREVERFKRETKTKNGK